jgi:hypothetical protein
VKQKVRLWQGELDVLVPRAHAEYLGRSSPTHASTSSQTRATCLSTRYPMSSAGSSPSLGQSSELN